MLKPRKERFLGFLKPIPEPDPDAGNGTPQMSPLRVVFDVCWRLNCPGFCQGSCVAGPATLAGGRHARGGGSRLAAMVLGGVEALYYIVFGEITQSDDWFGPTASTRWEQRPLRPEVTYRHGLCDQGTRLHEGDVLDAPSYYAQ